MWFVANLYPDPWFSCFQGHGFIPVYKGPLLSYRITKLRRNKEYKFRVSYEIMAKANGVYCSRKTTLNVYVSHRSQIQF